VGEAVLAANSQGRKSGPVRGPASSEPTPSAGQRDVVPNDAGDDSVQRNGEGVLRQPKQLEPIPVQPGDPIKQRGTRPGFIRKEEYEPKSHGITLFRHRYSRAAKAVENGKAKTREICLPLQSASEIVIALDAHKKKALLVLESIEDFEAVMANPEWLVPQKAKQIEMIVGTMHARITNLKNNLE
jgi:hypothetical protein